MGNKIVHAVKKVAPYVAPIPYTIAKHILDKPARPKINPQLLYSTQTYLSQVRKSALESQGQVSKVLTLLDTSMHWKNLSLSFEIVQHAEQFLDGIHGLKIKWSQLQNQLAKIENAKKSTPNWEDAIFSGALGMMPGIAGILFHLVESTSTINAAKQLSIGVNKAQTLIFNVQQEVKEAVHDGKATISESKIQAWSSFAPLFKQELSKLQTSLRQLVTGTTKLQDQLHVTGQHNVAMVALAATPPPPPPAWHQQKLLVLDAAAPDPVASKRKEVVNTAANVTAQKISQKLTTATSNVRNDSTKFHAVTACINSVSPAKPTPEDSTWASLEKIAKEISNWGQTFVADIKKAPITDSTRTECYHVMMDFKNMLQTTAQKLQNYRLAIDGIHDALDNVLYVLHIPESALASLTSLETPEKIKAIQAHAMQNTDALKTGLKQLSDALNNHTALDNLNNLGKAWTALGGKIQHLQTDVKDDIDAYKKKMKIIGYVTMGLTVVIGLAAICLTCGAAAPEVGAEIGAEVATETEIASTEVGETVATDTMAESSIEGATEAGETEATAVEDVAPESNASKIFSKATSVLKTLGVMAALGEAGKLTKGEVDKIAQQHVALGNAITDGLATLADDANKMQTMLTYIYANFSDVTHGELSKHTNIVGAWGTINVKPIIENLKSGMDNCNECRNELKSTQDTINDEIVTFDNNIFQPMQELYGN